MKRRRCTDEPIVHALRQVAAGMPAVALCRTLGSTEQTLYRWKRKFAGLGVAALRRPRDVEDEHRRLKQLVADLSRDQHLRPEALRKNGSSRLSNAVPCSAAGSAFE